MIAKGHDWGRRARVPADVETCSDDASLGALVARGRGRADDIDPVLLTGGDLHRTLGGRPDQVVEPGNETTQVVCDIGEVLLDGAVRWFVAHLVIGGPWWARSTIVVANAAHMGTANVAPRAHPGDGKLDVIEARLSLRQRLLSVPRLRSGTHVPHPDIATSRCENRQFDLGARGRPIAIDGVDVGRIRQVVVRVKPSVLVVYVG